jgi:hypothetical protein
MLRSLSSTGLAAFLGSSCVLGACALAACSSSSNSSPPAGQDGGQEGGSGADAQGGTDAPAEAAVEAGAGSEGGSEASTPSCAPTSACTTADPTCIALTDNTGLTKFGLRMTDVMFSKPTALAAGIVASTVAGGSILSLQSCNLMGSGLFSWLLQFDTGASTLTFGGAKPVTDPTQGYSFDDEMLAAGATFHVQPATATSMLMSSGAYGPTAGTDLVLPIFLDAAGTTAVVVPMHQVSMSGTLSANQNCIGTYNAAGLDPLNSCMADSTHPLFNSGGTVTAFISLEDADTVVIAPLQETLCVLLSGNAGTYGDGMTPVQHCKRDTANAIVFQGDWCSTTNMAKMTGCADSVALAGSYAASGIKIN